MIKKITKKVFRLLGFDLRRIPEPSIPPQPPKNKKTKNLTYYQTLTGNYYLPTDAEVDKIANAIKSDLIFEKEIVDLAKQYIQPGSTVLDIGSNFGQMSILFSNIVGEKGFVHAFEADDWVYEILSKNILANNKEGKIIPHFGAVHNHAGENLIFPEHDLQEWGTYGAYGIDYTANTGREVKSITIDTLGIEKPISFMKVDIQGGDLQAMQGAIKTIEKNRMPILFEYEYHFEEKFNLSFQEYVDFVRSINYKFHKVLSGHNYLIVPQ